MASVEFVVGLVVQLPEAQLVEDVVHVHPHHDRLGAVLQQVFLVVADGRVQHVADLVGLPRPRPPRQDVFDAAEVGRRAGDRVGDELGEVRLLLAFVPVPVGPGDGAARGLGEHPHRVGQYRVVAALPARVAHCGVRCRVSHGRISLLRKGQEAPAASQGSHRRLRQLRQASDASSDGCSTSAWSALPARVMRVVA